MTPQQIIDAWNAQADEANQWGALGEDEKLMWAYKQAIAEAEKQKPVAWMTNNGARVITAKEKENYPALETQYSIPLYTHPPQRQEAEKQEPLTLPEGKRLIVVDSTFDDLMYWLERCDSKGHLENCPDLVEPWAAFNYSNYTSPPQRKPLLVGKESAEFAEWFNAVWLGDGEQGETIPTKGKEYDEYLSQYTLAFGAWMAAKKAAHGIKEKA